MKSIEKALKLIREDKKEIAEFVGPRDSMVLDMAEQALGLKFPPEYRMFLSELGAGNYGSTEILGVVDANFDVPSEIGVVWSTRDCWSKGMPKSCVLIRYFELGNECLRVDGASSQAAIVAHRLGAPESAQDYEIIAPSFGDYLINVVNKENECIC